MPRALANFGAAAFGLCLILLGVVFVLANLNFSPPAPLAADAPQDAFSAARAREELVRLLGDETPHPIGSDANRTVKAHIVARLLELGLTPQIQDAIGCSAKRTTCAHVQNVLARIDGASDSAILLMAHYDSVAYAPGAGDDGAGVAALLEVARAYGAARAPEQRNSIVFAFTDGEEPGLLGAEAFFAEHPWAKQVAVVINLEGSGSTGPVLLLRSGPRSGVVLDTFRSVGRYPVASSFAEELFKHLPNDTDFSVSMRAGKPGIDFAFAGERNHYHTALDSIANLNLGTLQHHGENVLPLVRALANQDLSKDAPGYVYATLTRSMWLTYSPATGVVWSIGVVVALGLATSRRWQGAGHFSGAFGIVALALMLIIALELAMLAAADLLAGTRVAWPANPWPWRLIIYAVPVVALALMRPLVRRVGFWNTLLAPWWLWALLVLAQACYLPLASHLMLPATVLATLVIVVLAHSTRLDRPVIRCTAALINALIAGYFMLPFAHIGEITQGLAAAPVMFVPLALLAVTMLPLLDRGHVKIPRWVGSIAVIAGLAWMHWVPLYSEQRPQHLNFTYALDADAGHATYAAWSPNTLPARVGDVMAFVKGPSPLPWERDPILAATATAETRPTTVLERAPANGTTRAFLLHPSADTDAFGLALPPRAPIDAIRIDGHVLSMTPSDGPEGYREVRFFAPPPAGARIEIDVAGDAPIDAYLIDFSYRLPASARPLTDARGSLAVPVHSGDRWVVFRRVTL